MADTISIIRSDNDIEKLFNRIDKTVSTILDVFINCQPPIHILRGVEPNLRYGSAIRNFLETSSDIPNCPLYINGGSNNSDSNMFNNNLNNINKYSNEIPLRYENLSNNINSNKCIHLASRKQIGDAIIRFEDKTIKTK